jgi:hypothetical protein
MVHNTVRMHFGKVRSHLLIPTSLLNQKQAGMKRSLLYGNSFRCWIELNIKMTRSSYLHETGLCQECD